MPDRTHAGRFHGSRRWTVLITLVLAAGAPRGARATETQWWIVDQASEHAESELKGATVEPAGAFELGPRATSSAAESLGTVWALALLPDGSVALGADRGRIDRWTASGGIRPWVRLGAGQVLSLAVDGSGLVAGTGPDGVIYRISARGDTSVVARTGERYVWGVAAGAKGVWYAATGTRGRVLRIQDGKVKVVLDTDESNLVSMISDGNGGVFAGGDSKGRVVHVRADGSARTVFDAPEDEVRGLVIGADRAIYAAALSSAAVSATTGSAGSGSTGGGEDADSGETDAAAAAGGLAPARGTGGRAVIYRIVPDSSAAVWWNAPQSLIYALARTPDGIVAATGNRAGVYFVPRVNGGMPWLAAPQGQITALAVDKTGRVFAAASNPAGLWQLGPARAEHGEVISPVFDAKRIARWGRIAWRGEARGGRIELATRSGNTDTPDTTWAPWHGVPNGERSASPPARYTQWRAVLAGGSPRVDAIDLAWREQNLPPRVDDVVVAPQAQAFREGELLPRTDPVTQVLPGGQKVEYSLPSATTPRQLRELPQWARGIRTVQWKGSDPNGDPLRYRLELGSSLDGPWTPLAEDLDSQTYTWDTNTLTDGSYRVRVVATDRIGNAVGEERNAMSVSEPFRVDNTPPDVTSFTAHAAAGHIRCEGAARDAASPVARVEIGIDNDDWRPVTPDGGFADGLSLSFHATLDGIKPGEHQVGVRVVDLAGNAATRAARVTVPAAR